MSRADHPVAGADGAAPGRGSGWAVFSFLSMLAGLIAGLMPLAMPLGLAAGGVLETGQVAFGRWWLGLALVAVVFWLASWTRPKGPRLWWLAITLCGLATAVWLLVAVASRDQTRPADLAASDLPRGRVGVLTALPLFWPHALPPDAVIASPDRKSAFVRALPWRAEAIDRADRRTLDRFDRLLLAQPGLLDPAELVELDGWVRRGGKALIFADPLTLWPSDLAIGDARRPPMTSLLDPLLAHWGLRLEGADGDRTEIDRRMLATGHVLLTAGASRFVPVQGGPPTGARCVLAERGFLAACRIGRGDVRLVADADLLDERLWLADPRWLGRPEAYASDIVALADAWLRAPLAQADAAAPRRVADDSSLIAALRLALVACAGWAILGWLGHGRILARRGPTAPSFAEPAFPEQAEESRPPP